ncbi:hypothetical protein SDC9_81267 [bioreactor metagenome]|uniref:DUF4956 domain-containing protein n=1 Tax=bioreactor metagenome TaxID=1076179 RepID=A0A644Z1B7_9ZZZZ
MLDSVFTTTIGAVSVSSLLAATAVSLVLGTVAAVVHRFRNTVSKQFSITLALLPVIVQIVILLVNGNLGTGVAIAGAFSLVRFRSVPGTARDICSIFLAMVIGLAAGTGYLAVAALLVLVVGGMSLIFTVSPFGESKGGEKELKITIPENLDYTGAFDDLFTRYTHSARLDRVRTTNMGSLYQLTYRIALKDASEEKNLLDDLRCRNGNLEISCGKVSTAPDSL